MRPTFEKSYLTVLQSELLPPPPSLLPGPQKLRVPVRRVASESSEWENECVLQRVAACCSVLQRVASESSECVKRDVDYECVLQRVAACCRVLQRVAVCCCVLQHVAV